MKRSSILLFFHLIVFTSRLLSQVVINEIMYAPEGGEPEWVELQNISHAAVNLRSWKIGDASTMVLITQGDILIQPNEYLIVTKDSSILTFHSDIHCAIIKVALPSLNNSGDAVRISNASGIIIDSVYYGSSWGGANGHSLERADTETPVQDSSNWKSSLDTARSTPGRINSIARRNRDVALFSISLVHDVEKNFLVTIKNAGRIGVDSIAVALYDDRNHDSILTEDENISSGFYGSVLTVGDTVSLLLPWHDVRPGIHFISGVVRAKDDEQPLNDTVRAEVRLPFRRNDLLISEIMYEPRTKEAEYVEYYNPCEQTIDLRDWKFFDRASQTTGKADTITFTRGSFLVPAHSYIAIASDSTIFNRFPQLASGKNVIVAGTSSLGLNNDDDDAVLSDMLSTIIDSVHYESSWHDAEVLDTHGRSLELVSFSLPAMDRHSWTTSVAAEGGTPGMQNSVFQTSPSRTNVTISVSPNPFSPDGDGHDDKAMILLKFESNVVKFMCDVYDRGGRRVRRLANNERMGEEVTLLWDGRDDDDRLLTMGRYIIHVEGVDSSGRVLIPTQTTVVLAKRL